MNTEAYFTQKNQTTYKKKKNYSNKNSKNTQRKTNLNINNQNIYQGISKVEVQMPGQNLSSAISPSIPLSFIEKGYNHPNDFECFQHCSNWMLNMTVSYSDSFKEIKKEVQYGKMLNFFKSGNSSNESQIDIIDYLPIDIKSNMVYVISNNIPKIPLRIEYDLKNDNTSIFSNVQRELSNYLISLNLNGNLHQSNTQNIVKIFKDDISFAVKGFDILKSIMSELSNLAKKPKNYQDNEILSINTIVIDSVQIKLRITFIISGAQLKNYFNGKYHNPYLIPNYGIKIISIQTIFNLPLIVFSYIYNKKYIKQMQMQATQYMQMNSPYNSNLLATYSNNNGMCLAQCNNSINQIQQQTNTNMMMTPQINAQSQQQYQIQGQIQQSMNSQNQMNMVNQMNQEKIQMISQINSINNTQNEQIKSQLMNNGNGNSLSQIRSNSYNSNDNNSYCCNLCNWNLFMTASTPLIYDKDYITVNDVMKSFIRYSLFGLKVSYFSRIFKGRKTVTYFPSLTSVNIQCRTSASTNLTNTSIQQEEGNNLFNSSTLSISNKGYQKKQTNNNNNNINIDNSLDSSIISMLSTGSQQLFEDQGASTMSSSIFNKKVSYVEQRKQSYFMPSFNMQYNHFKKIFPEIDDVSLNDISNDSYFSILWTPMMTRENSIKECEYSFEVFYNFINSSNKNLSTHFLNVLAIKIKDVKGNDCDNVFLNEYDYFWFDNNSTEEFDYNSQKDFQLNKNLFDYYHKNSYILNYPSNNGFCFDF